MQICNIIHETPIEVNIDLNWFHFNRFWIYIWVKWFDTWKNSIFFEVFNVYFEANIEKAIWKDSYLVLCFLKYFLCYLKCFSGIIGLGSHNIRRAKHHRTNGLPNHDAHAELTAMWKSSGESKLELVQITVYDWHV